MVMLFSVPVFTVGSYLDEPNSYNYGLSLIHTLGPASRAGKKVFEDTIAIQTQLTKTPLVRLYIDSNVTLTDLGNSSHVLEWK